MLVRHAGCAVGVPECRYFRADSFVAIGRSAFAWARVPLGQAIWCMMMIEPPVRYEYAPKWPLVIVLCLLTGLGSAWGIWLALTGGIIGGNIPFLHGPVAAWVFAGLGVCSLIGCLAMAAIRVVTPTHIEMSKTEMILPFCPRIAYSTILGTTEIRFLLDLILIIRTQRRGYSMFASFLPSRCDYLEIREFLSQFPRDNGCASRCPSNHSP